MSQFLYIDEKGWFHKRHPSGKIIALLIAFIPPLSFNHPLYLLCLWLIIIPAGIYSKGFQLLFRLRWLFFGICLASFVLWTIFTRGGTILFSISALSITNSGMIYASGMALRLGFLLFLGLIFIASTSIEDLYYGLVKLKIPFPMSFALSLSFRLVPIFSENARTILQAQRSRGLKIEAGLTAKLKSYFPLFVPVFLSALRKVDQLSIALEARGFGAGIKRSSWVEYKFSFNDWLLLALSLGLCAVCLGLRLSGLGMVKF